jgi:uncharacterized membrane protein (UPF0127 family)
MTKIKTRSALAGALLALGALALQGSAHAQSAPQPPLPTVSLTAGGMHVIRAEVARTPAERATGMMMRTEMASNAGMLFLFDYEGPQCFWMKNTLLPLSIAFIADDGTIVGLADMQPKTLENHCSEKPVRYALEMNQGWFAKRGIKLGAKLQGGPFGAK